MIQYILLSYALTIGPCIIAFAVGSYHFTMAMNKCIKMSLFGINQHSNAEVDRPILLGQLDELIELHSSAKQLSEMRFKINLSLEWHTQNKDISSSFIFRFISDFTNLFEIFITTLFVWSLVTICGALLMIQYQFVIYCFGMIESVFRLIKL